MTMVIVHWLIMCHANYDKIQNGKKNYILTHRGKSPQQYAK